MAARWVEWLGDRITSTRTASAELADAEFRVLLEVFAALIGPLRREVRPVWAKATERYGRHAAARGLAAGEVVEEMQYLRELLIRYLAPAIAALRPRQGMALLLRLNRLVDKGVAMAVVGYTDELVKTLIPAADGDAPDRVPDGSDLEAWLHTIRNELEAIISHEVHH